MKKIFLTGSTGFIGRNILECFSGSYEFFAPSHSELDLANAAAVEKFLAASPVDLVIHTANVGGTRKTTGLADAVESNLKMFWSVARLQGKYFKRMIFLGTGAEYGKQGDITMVREQDFDTRVPSDSLGVYKYTVSKYIEGQQGIVNLRIFGIYGKYEDQEIRFISKAITCAIKGEPMRVFQNAKFEYLYVDDFLNILQHFIEHEPKEKFYNVGTGKPVELLTLLKEVEQVTGKNIEHTVEKPGYANEYTCNSDRLKKEIPGLTFTPRMEAIKKLYESLR